MEFRDSPEEAAFRQGVRDFVDGSFDPRLVPEGWQQYPDPRDETEAELLREWRGALGERGWIAPHWPRDFGGAGLTAMEQFIFNEEMAKIRAPEVGGIGMNMVGPTLIRHGSEQQKETHLPRITSNRAIWCQGYSEPGAGSDLASLQTRAARDGDEYVLNGQKVWNTVGHKADWMLLLARTDPAAPKHRGITMFLLDMKTPGITTQPIVTAKETPGIVEWDINEVFFEDVRIPATNRVGEENQGWYYATTLLDLERSRIGASIALLQEVESLVEYVRAGQRGEQPLAEGQGRVRELTDAAIAAQVSRLMAYRVVSMLKRGDLPNYEASIKKLFTSETAQGVTRTAMKLIGLYGNLWRTSASAPLEGRIPYRYVAMVPTTIAGGTSEIQRNIISTRGLGLPRG
ncbi:MAG: hypothetical protein F4150_03000 [Chloroflexi bacterium]|nr:hypothetical protein [Chloroflexota bacterium]